MSEPFPNDENERDRPGKPDARIVPMFPLPNAILIPGAVLPLHIFEPRYRQMIEDLLDGPGRLVLANIREEAYEQMAGTPPVHEIAGLGEIVRHLRFPDGRFLIWLVGLGRVQIREIPSDRLYRTVEAMQIEEAPADSDGSCELTEDLAEAIRERVRDASLPYEKLGVGVLSDILLQCLVMTGLTASRAQALYEEVCAENRARAVLDTHRACPVDSESRGTLSLSDSMAVGLPAAIGDSDEEFPADSEDSDPFDGSWDPGDPDFGTDPDWGSRDEGSF